MAQAVTCAYICNLINQVRGTALTPAEGTANEAASMEYLLKLVDQVNGGSTSYGTGVYATGEWADTQAAMDAVERLIAG